MLELAASEHADFMKFPACRGASTPDMPASRAGRGLVKTWMCVCCRNSYSSRTSTQLPRSVNLFVSRQPVRAFHEISPNAPVARCLAFVDDGADAPSQGAARR